MMGRAFPRYLGLTVLSCLFVIFTQCQHILATPTTSWITERDNVFTINNAGLKKTGWHWVDTWTAMPQLTEPANLPNPPFVRSDIQQKTLICFPCWRPDTNDNGIND
jgi:hypothetical protein